MSLDLYSKVGFLGAELPPGSELRVNGATWSLMEQHGASWLHDFYVCKLSQKSEPMVL
jgi:hypothetical protein